MSDVAYSTSKIQVEGDRFRSPVSESLMQAMGGAINFLLDNFMPLGVPFGGFLTEAQLQSQVGAGFVLCDGRSITGTRLNALTGATTIPDMRGMAFKGHNGTRSDGKEDPEAPSLSSFQAQSVQHHTHAWFNFTGAVAEYFDGSGQRHTYSGTAIGTAKNPNPNYDASLNTIYTTGVTQLTGIVQVTGITNEPVDRTARTRVHSTIGNWFIRIN